MIAKDNFSILQSLYRQSLDLLLTILLVSVTSCAPKLNLGKANLQLPDNFGTATVQKLPLELENFFTDPHLKSLIKLALKNNQELKIVQQELVSTKAEAEARGAAYMPLFELGFDTGLDKVGRYTRFGAIEENLPIREGRKFPEPLTDFRLGLRSSWEIDIWDKLHDAERAAVSRFLASVEGRNFMVTNLVAEIAKTYYDILTLDAQLVILEKNIQVQTDAFRLIKLEKEVARLNELALKRFEAQLFSIKGLRFEIMQALLEEERRLNFLVGRFPQDIKRGKINVNNMLKHDLGGGIPSDLLRTRPDIKQAEFEVAASEFDMKVAHAEFYPSLRITADLGYQAYKLKSLLTTPDSLLYSLASELTAPIINRRLLKAELKNATAKQRQAIFNYERKVLEAFIDVSNQLSAIQNLQKSFGFKNQQVAALGRSVDISHQLFVSARADYTEVLLTQRDAFEAQFELTEVERRILYSYVDLYRSLGGGV